MNVANGPMTLYLQAWPDLRTADSVLHELSRLQRAGSVDIVGAGSLVCDEEGNFHTRQANPDVSTGALVGLLGGMLVGLLGGPVFWLGGSAVGALSGALVEHFVKFGFTGSQLEAIQASMTRGSSAVFAVVYDHRVAAFEEQLGRLADVSLENLMKVGLRRDVANQLAEAMTQARQKDEAAKQEEVATR